MACSPACRSPRLAPSIVPGAMLSSSTQRAHRPLLLEENAPRDAWRAQRLLGLAPLRAEGAGCCLTAGHLEGKCGLCSMGSSACPGSGMKQSSTWSSTALLDAGVVGSSSLSPHNQGRRYSSFYGWENWDQEELYNRQTGSLWQVSEYFSPAPPRTQKKFN